jgi:hypothetical protein
MTGGGRVSARERESAREQAALLGRACAGASSRARCSGPFGWAELKEERRSRPGLILFFFFKIVNSGYD